MPIILVGESLAELERHLEALKKMDVSGKQTSTPDHQPVARAASAPFKAASPPELSRQVQRLKQRVTRTTGKVWDLVVAASSLPEGKEFSLADLATAMGERHSRVQSWHRILARPCKRLNLTVIAKVAGSERPTKFTMPPEVRKAVQSLTNVKPQGPKRRRAKK